MSKYTFFALLLCLFFLAGMRPHVVEAQSADAILQQVNQFRLNNGLPALSYNAALASAAQNQANYMAEFGVFSSHMGYGGSWPQSRAEAAGYYGRVSENIVGGTNLTAPRGLTWWVNSPTHYNTLITTQYSQAGTGFARAGDVNYYVLLVGQPGDAPTQPAASNSDGPGPLFVTPITLAQPGEDGSIVHTVQDGQALWSLAAHYDVPLSQLLLYNGLPADAFVHPGDAIIIQLAEGAPPPPTPTPATSHIVREGESLWSIASMYDVKIGDVMWYNNLTEESFLYAGQEVKVRLAEGELPPPTPTPLVNHIVQAGQTPWEIALMHGLTLEELKAFNNMADNAIINPGDELRIRPLDTATPTPLPTSTETPSPLPPTMTPQPTSLAMSLPRNTAVAANIALQSVGSTPLPTAVASMDESEAGSPWLMGSLVFVAGLLTLAGVAVVAMRREKI